MSGWIAVDLDGTLAEYHGCPKDGSIGAPVPEMVERVNGWLAEGLEVRIFTARVWPIGTLHSVCETGDRVVDAYKQYACIEAWCRCVFGVALPITCVKDYGMIQLWDDRVVQVKINTGIPVAKTGLTTALARVFWSICKRLRPSAKLVTTRDDDDDF